MSAVGLKKGGIVIESKKRQRSDRCAVAIAQADIAEREVGGPIRVISEPHGLQIDGHLRMGDAVRYRKAVPAPQHFSKHASGVDLRARGYVGGVRLRLEGHTEKALVETPIDELIVGPDRPAGVVGIVRFGDHPENAAKAIDYKVVQVILGNKR